MKNSRCSLRMGSCRGELNPLVKTVKNFKVLFSKINSYALLTYFIHIFILLVEFSYLIDDCCKTIQTHFTFYQLSTPCSNDLCPKTEPFSLTRDFHTFERFVSFLKKSRNHVRRLQYDVINIVFSKQFFASSDSNLKKAIFILWVIIEKRRRDVMSCNPL